AAIPDPAAILAAPEPELLPSEPVIAEAVLAEPVLAEPVLAAPTEESASSAAIPVQEEPTSEESPAATALQPVAEALPEDTPAEMSPLPSAATLPLPTRRIVAIPGPNGTAYVVQNADEPLSPEVLAPVAESAAPIPAPVAQQPEPLPPAAEPVVAHQPAEAPLPEPQLAVSSPAAATPAAAPPAPARTPDAPPSIPAPEPALAASLSTASQPAAPAPQHQKHDRQRQSHASRKAEKKARARQRAAKSESDRRDGQRRRFTFQQPPSEGAASGPSLKTRFVRWLTAPPQAAKRMRAPKIVAYFWTGGTPRPHTVANISVTGLYIVTKDRWLPDTVIVMNLQWTDCDGTHPGDTISVLSKVVRFGEDGVGFQFVTSDAVNAVDGQYLPGKGSDRTALDRFLWRRKRLAATA
ncbi:MAG: PilZ domain-containing protein, partial [Acidobacteriota bacterium]|nr:PilZ domain-containing protein [Acidobacteriota bacterium]